MKTYLLSAAGVIFISVIVSLIVPEGKLHKTITFVMRLICILVLISPALALFKISPSPSQSDREIADYAFVAKEYSRHQSEQLTLAVGEKFSVEAECTVSVEYSDGLFRAESAEVVLPEENRQLIESIYEYLNGLGYINISVYAKSA